MTTSPQILPTTALLRPLMPGVYDRDQIYDPVNNTSPTYVSNYSTQKIVPAIWSIVRDYDSAPLWVTAIDPVTLYPSYLSMPLSQVNDNVVSLLDYGNTQLRLYTDTRHLPYPVTPDSKCVIIGKSPRFYTLTRYPKTKNETIISEYYDATGKRVSQMVPVVALDESRSSWYLPRCHVNVVLDHNEEVEIKVYSEDNVEVFSALLFAKASAVVNEDGIYSPTIVSMTITGNQRLPNGTFFVYEKQDFDSLGLTASLVYDDGTTQEVPVDGTKCILYGKDDFISSFAGLTQQITIKYFRSARETLDASIADPTGSMIAKTVPVTVIPNAFATTNKILPIPVYNKTLARYVLRYWLYFSDGRSHIDVTPYVNITVGNLVGDSSYFGVDQVFTIAIDMNKVDPEHYLSTTIYQQTIVAKFGPPTSLVKWTLRDATAAFYILGQDNSSSRRPSIRYDATRKQYFIPTSVFANKAAFLNSFYTQAAPPFDPSVVLVPQQPTHFVVRDILTGNQLVSAPITVANYNQAFNVIDDTVGNYVDTAVIVEFINKFSATETNILYACPVDVSTGSYTLPA